jgi:hypothetical protein
MDAAGRHGVGGPWDAPSETGRGKCYRARCDKIIELSQATICFDGAASLSM